MLTPQGFRGITLPNFSALRIVLSMFFFIFAFLSFASLFAEDESSIPKAPLLASIESEPSGIIDGCVQVISGCFFDYDVDLVVPGPVPLKVERTLVNNNLCPFAETKMKPPMWAINNRQYLYLSDASKGENTRFIAAYHGPLGELIHFSFNHVGKPQSHIANVTDKMLTNGQMNTSQGVIGAQTNIRNNTVKYSYKHQTSVLYSSSGSCLSFTRQSKTGFSELELGTCKIHFLREEYMPNRLKKTYTYNSRDKLSESYLKTGLNQELSRYRVVRHQGSKFDTASYEADDGRKATYYFNRYRVSGEGLKEKQRSRKMLKKVVRTDKPNIDYTYTNGFIQKSIKWANGRDCYYHWPRVSSKIYPNDRFINILYYNPFYIYFDPQTASKDVARVKEIKAPLGADADPITKYRFVYSFDDSGGCTGVYDALGQKTDYGYNARRRLTSIVKFNEHGIAYSTENLVWGPEDTHKEVELQSRSYGAFWSPYKIFGKTYGYDVAGNIVVETLHGNITGKHNGATLQLDGSGMPIYGTADDQIKYHTYSDDCLHLLLNTTLGDKSQEFIYIPKTNLLAACFHKDKGVIYLRHFYSYDDKGSLIEHVMDDGTGRELNDLQGVTERKIDRIKRTNKFPFGLPKEVMEFYLDLKTGEELLVKKRVNEHDLQGRLTREEVYGSDGVFAYATQKQYDAHGNVICQIAEDGAATHCEYDQNDNMTAQVGPHPGLRKEFSYDFMNRLITAKDIHPDIVLSKHYHYDVGGNLISKVDAMGNQTKITYDLFHRPIAVFANGITRYEYDEMSNPVKIISPEGTVTEFAYTIFAKPYHIRYPDRTEERFEYDIEGRLIKEILKNGSEVSYKYDIQGRVVNKSHGGEEIISTYNTFHLLSETDPSGHTTYFTYDSRGRKETETKGDFITRFEYDSLGRVSKTIVTSFSHPEEGSVKVVLLDFCDRILEERIENIQGDVLSTIRYEYDEGGRKTRIETSGDAGTSVTMAVFDTHGTPVTTIDPAGNVTTVAVDLNYFNSLGQRVLKTEVQDPQGKTTISIQDIFGRTAEEIVQDPFGNEIKKTAYKYNHNGKCIQTTDTVYHQGTVIKEITNAWEYDYADRLVATILAVGTDEEQKVTHAYNQRGELESTEKPNGVSLHFAYDEIGRLKEQMASDGSVHYRYAYDANSNPVKVENLMQNNCSIRIYDEHNRVAKETLANGLEVSLSYTPEGSVKTITYQDGSSVYYRYNGPLLTAVERNHYKHTYDKYDSSGNLLQASLINDLGPIKTGYTLRGEIEELESCFYKEKLSYDNVGNLYEKTGTDDQGDFSESYAYDAFYQLANESGHFNHEYTNDSLFNRMSKDGNVFTLNSLNSLLNDGESDYSYDPCGNLTGYTKHGKEYQFSYDALDRLTKMQIDGVTYRYTYDEQNRCITRSENEKVEKILFIGQDDVGTADFDNNFKALRILGKGRGAEISASIAIELDGTVFAPLHDHRGNIIALIHPDGHIAESYRYSAFGEEEVFSHDKIDNPWRFSSKRKEADLSLFGIRFYIPELGRWLTPDPAGHAAGPNLYAFANNSPLIYFDRYGHFVECIALLAEICYFLWEGFKTGLIISCSYAANAISYAGAGIKLASEHLIPFPIVKDIGCLLGHYMENGTLDGYENSMSNEFCSQSRRSKTESNNPKVAHVFINGICNWLGDALEASNLIVSLYGFEIPVHTAYNGTCGLIGDLIECAAFKLGICTPAVQEAVNSIRAAINDVGGVGNGGTVKVDAHSQGGLIATIAMNFLSEDERAMICLSTYGSASLATPKGLKGCVHYVNNFDLVPLIADPIRYIAARLGFKPEVKFVESKSWIPGAEHAFKETYTEEIRRDADVFKNKFYSF